MKRKEMTLGSSNALQNATFGLIMPEALYTRAALLMRMGWRDASLREAFRAGLKGYKAGKRIYFLGSDVIQFVASSGKLVRHTKNMAPDNKEATT